MSTSPQLRFVFISYKREDALIAGRVREALANEGFNIWWDEDLQCGQAWAEKLDEAVRDAACIIVLWSEGSLDSQWVRHEASQAIARQVYAPCRIELVQLDSPYDRIQATDLINWDGDRNHGGIRNLIQRVNTLVPPPTFTTSPNRALVNVEPRHVDRVRHCVVRFGPSCDDLSRTAC